MVTANFVAVLPSLVPEMTEACMDTMSSTLRERLLVVDNSVENHGVPVAWNDGIDTMRLQNADWLIVLSAGLRFGSTGGLDLIAQLSRSCHKHEAAVEGGNGLGWHCIAFNAEALQQVGPFDPRFSPAYYEDNDWAYRAYCRYGWDPAGPWWPKVPVDATLVETAHGLKSGKVKVDMSAQLAKYVDKHGGPPGEEAFRDTYGSCPVCRDVWEICGGTHGLA